jgi:transglutaminase-like putative cysteine protease
MLSLFSGLAILPHGLHLPIQLNLYLLLLFLWRFASLHYPRLQPGRWILVLATLGGVILVFNQFHTVIGRDAGVALLAVMMMLKSLEVRKRRDLYITVFISYFVIITHFLFDQSMAIALYLILIMVCLSTLLVEINRVKPPQHWFDPVIRTGIITLQAVPIALILFVIFPRMTQPLWNLGIGASGKTGHSDRVIPGQISQLVESPEVAFRVTFDREPPPPQERYWRGLVIWDTDGIVWYNDPRRQQSVRKIQFNIPGEHSYEVFLEAHHKSWLYALDLPIKTAAKASLTTAFELYHANSVNQSLQYKVSSTTVKQNRILLPGMQERALELADNVTQRQLELVDQWRSKTDNPSEIVELALAHFHNQPFVYTLTPPRYLDNPIDEFLFEGREGFCEHYATTFTQLMRIAGIPARLILGYQGGEFNDMGDYFIIRQYDAHAWSEVWLDEFGWKRIDPTAAVAPERIRFQIRNIMSEQGSPVTFHLDSSGILGSTMRRIAHMLDNANVQWRRWVIGYSREHQFSLMRNFGFDALSRLQWGIITVVLIAIPLLLVGMRLVLSGKRKPSPVVLAYTRFCLRLSRIGITRQPHEGPLDYAKRATSARPDLTAPISRITSLYIQLRYGPRPDNRQIQTLLRQIKQFRPNRYKA